MRGAHEVLEIYDDAGVKSSRERPHFRIEHGADAADDGRRAEIRTGMKRCNKTYTFLSLLVDQSNGGISWQELVRILWLVY